MEQTRQQVEVQLGKLPASKFFELMRAIRPHTEMNIYNPANWPTFKTLLAHYATKN